MTSQDVRTFRVCRSYGDVFQRLIAAEALAELLIEGADPLHAMQQVYGIDLLQEVLMAETPIDLVPTQRGRSS
ncbi:MAG: hypothetical protein H6526_08930 [Actinobacteria bacterium]|nr:hypothetical protein [Actinomycetota bacterium]